jgi:glucose-6-phosphate dehydrogenase assembly protein OpcA
MSDATAAPFFEGQGISVELRDVEAELTKLWGPAALELAGSDALTPHVTRVVLANLVVECLGGNALALEPVLETVMARFPCRAILLCVADDLDRRVTAEISALCHLPSPGLPQVCSERIVLRAGKNAVDLLPGAVRSLLEANLPHLLWWTGDPRMHEPLFRELAVMCSRLVLDLPDPGGEAGALKLGLDPALGACSRDSAWFGLARWRELVAQFFDAPGEIEKLRRIESVTIDAISSDPAHPPRAAVWLLAWLAGQLDWKPKSYERRPPAEDNSCALVARFQGPSGDVESTIVTRSIPGCTTARSQLAGLTLKTGGPAGETFRLVRPWPGSPAVLVETETQGSVRLPRGIEAPELDPARRIATALESSSTDVAYRNARPIALWLMQHADS